MRSALFGCLGPDERHTVPRAELMALLQLLKASIQEEDLLVYSDCKYVVRGIARGRGGGYGGPHEDLWQQVWKEIGQRSGGVRVVWVKAHATKDSIKKFRLTEEQVIGNALADHFAKQGAALAPRVNTDFDAMDSIVWLVQRRIVSAHILAAGHNSSACKEGRGVSITPKEQRCLAERRRKELMESSTHQLQPCNGGWHCLICKVAVNSLSNKWLLRSFCQGDAAVQWSAGSSSGVRVPIMDKYYHLQIGQSFVHPSHTVARYRGFYWCWKCGSSATGSAGIKSHSLDLTRPCIGPTKSKKDLLARMRKGKTPKEDRDWPEPADTSICMPIDPFV